jgi:hypothetical protein
MGVRLKMSQVNERLFRGRACRLKKPGPRANFIFGRRSSACQFKEIRERRDFADFAAWKPQNRPL